MLDHADKINLTKSNQLTLLKSRPALPRDPHQESPVCKTEELVANVTLFAVIQVIVMVDVVHPHQLKAHFKSTKLKGYQSDAGSKSHPIRPMPGSIDGGWHW